MLLKNIYNEIAGQYAIANQFGSISRSHACAIKQICEAMLRFDPGYPVLDLGVGNAQFLRQLNILRPELHLTGIDISSEMLKLAKMMLPDLVVFEASAAEAHHFIPLHSQKMVVAHFINAYVPIETLFSEVELMLSETGHFSFVTTTYDSFLVAQRYLTEFIAKNTWLSRVVAYYYKKMIKHTTVALDQGTLLATFDKHHFEVLSHQRLRIPIRLNTIDELATFGIKGTWFLNTLAISWIPRFILIPLMRQFIQKIFVFPYEDEHVIDVVFAKKKQ